MERLTSVWGENYELTCCLRCFYGFGDKCTTCKKRNNVIVNLSSYEDTGLTPEEIRESLLLKSNPLTNFQRITVNPKVLAEQLVDASRYQESAFMSPAYAVNGTEYRNRDNAVRDMVEWLNQPPKEDLSNG